MIGQPTDSFVYRYTALSALSREKIHLEMVSIGVAIMTLLHMNVPCNTKLLNIKNLFQRDYWYKEGINSNFESIQKPSNVQFPFEGFKKA